MSCNTVHHLSLVHIGSRVSLVYTRLSCLWYFQCHELELSVSPQPGSYWQQDIFGYFHFGMHTTAFYVAPFCVVGTSGRQLCRCHVPELSDSPEPGSKLQLRRTGGIQTKVTQGCFLTIGLFPALFWMTQTPRTVPGLFNFHRNSFLLRQFVVNNELSAEIDPIWRWV